jgi:hypothetical protein
LARPATTLARGLGAPAGTADAARRPQSRGAPQSAVAFALAKKQADYIEDLAAVLKASGHLEVSSAHTLQKQTQEQPLSGYLRLSRDTIIPMVPTAVARRPGSSILHAGSAPGKSPGRTVPAVRESMSTLSSTKHAFAGRTQKILHGVAPRGHNLSTRIRRPSSGDAAS